MDISVVVPLFNEDESLPELSQWIDRVMKENNYSYEIIFVDDGSNDHSWQVIEQISKQNPNIKAIRFQRNYGKSPALHTGFKEVEGDVVITMDADLQDSPDEIPALYNMIMKDGYDLVSGWKQKRYDPISKTIPSKFFNWVARITTGIKLHDFNCGLKAYRKKVVKSIEVYGEMHRFMPVLAKQAGFTKITEKVVTHRARKYGVTKFGLSRFINGYLDLMTVLFITKFSKSPMHFFGAWGTLSFIMGFGVLFYLSIAKLIYHQYQMTQRPLFFLGLLLIIFGSQLFLTGFLGDLVSRSSGDRNHYLIEENLNLD